MRIRMLTISLLALLGAFGFLPDAAAQGSARSRVLMRGGTMRPELDQTFRLLQARGSLFPTSHTTTRSASPFAKRGDVKGETNLLSLGSGNISGHISGITDRTNLPMVLAYSEDPSGGMVVVPAKVEPSGDYRIDQLDDGDYVVMLQAEGCITKFYDNVSTPDSATMVRVSGSTGRGGIDFTMETVPVGTGSISGSVLAEWTSAPLAGGTVIAFATDNSFQSYQATVEDDGTFHIDGMVGGRYMVAAMADGFFPEYYENAMTPDLATEITVVEPGDVGGIDFLLSRGATISGRVLDGNGNPIANALVEAIQSSASDSLPGAYGVGISDDNGNYEISTLAEGDYIVSASIWTDRFGMTLWYDGATDFSTATHVPVSVARPATGIDFNMTLPVGNGSIAGTVFDGNGNPVEGASVIALADPSSGITVFGQAMTAADGTYRIDSLPDGAYIVGAFASSGWQSVNIWWRDAALQEDADPVVLRGGTCAVGAVDFNLPFQTGSASISGTVHRPDGSPLANALVMVIPSSPVCGIPFFGDMVMTDDNGVYHIESLPEGSYLAYAAYWENESYDDQWYLNAEAPELATEITVAAGEGRDGVDFTLDPRLYYGTISGRVTDDATGQPVAGAYVQISPVFDGSVPFLPMGEAAAVTDANGEYAADYIGTGRYMVSVIGNGSFEIYENATSPERATLVDVTGGAATTVNFGLTPRNEGNGSISGVVTDESGAAIGSAVILALAENDPSALPFTAISAADGSYRMTGLPAGRFYLLSFAQGYIGEYFSDAYDASQATLAVVSDGGAVTGIDFDLAASICFPDGGPTGGPRNGGAIRGTVADIEGNGIVGATVHLINGNGQAVSSVRSGADGRYELVGLPSGSEYRVMASSPGFDSRYNNEARRFEEATPLAVGIGRPVDVDFMLSSSTSSAPAEPGTISGLELKGNHPNPFTSGTSIELALAEPGHVKLTVLDITGREVARLHDGRMSAGEHAIRWNGTSADGSAAANGVYIYRVEVDGKATAGRMILAR